MPAQELGEAGKYLAAAYVVFLALVLIYVAIMAQRLSRIQRELTELTELAQGDATAEGTSATAQRSSEEAGAL